MILRALTTIVLEDSSGTIAVHEGDFFRSPSQDVVTQGYARHLTKEEAKHIVSNYAAFAVKIFTPTQSASELTQKNRRSDSTAQRTLFSLWKQGHPP